MVSGAGGQRGFAENGPRVGLSMESNMCETPQENEGCRGSVGLKDSAGGQKTNFEWTSIWRAKCKEFYRKAGDLGGQKCWGTGSNHRKGT